MTVRLVVEDTLENPIKLGAEGARCIMYAESLRQKDSDDE